MESAQWMDVAAVVSRELQRCDFGEQELRVCQEVYRKSILLGRRCAVFPYLQHLGGLVRIEVKHLSAVLEGLQRKCVLKVDGVIYGFQLPVSKWRAGERIKVMVRRDAAKRRFALPGRFESWEELDVWLAGLDPEGSYEKGGAVGLRGLFPEEDLEWLFRPCTEGQGSAIRDLPRRIGATDARHGGAGGSSAAAANDLPGGESRDLSAAPGDSAVKRHPTAPEGASVPHLDARTGSHSGPEAAPGRSGWDGVRAAVESGGRAAESVPYDGSEVPSYGTGVPYDGSGERGEGGGAPGEFHSMVLADGERMRPKGLDPGGLEGSVPYDGTGTGNAITGNRFLSCTGTSGSGLKTALGKRPADTPGEAKAGELRARPLRGRDLAFGEEEALAQIRALFVDPKAGALEMENWGKRWRRIHQHMPEELTEAIGEAKYMIGQRRPKWVSMPARQMMGWLKREFREAYEAVPKARLE